MSARKELEKYLDKVKTDISTNLTLNSFRTNASNIIEENGKLYFEMTRHASALGAQSFKGSPMAAFTTRLEKYMFDPEKQQIFITYTSEETIDLKTIEYFHLATEHLSNVSFRYIKEDDGSYLMKEAETGFSVKISDESEIEEELSDFASELNLEYDPRFEILPEDQRDIVIERLETVCNELAIQKAKQDWLYNRDS